MFCEGKEGVKLLCNRTKYLAPLHLKHFKDESFLLFFLVRESFDLIVICIYVSG